MAEKDSPNNSRVKTIYNTIYSPSLTVRIKYTFYRKYLKIQGLNVMICDKSGAMISFLHFTHINKKTISQLSIGRAGIVG